MPETVTNIIILLALFLIVAVMICLAFKVLKNKFAPVKTVRAVVIDKHKTEAFSKYSGTGKRSKYVVVFSAGGKKLSFYVSEFSYNNYRRDQSGTLKYKGDRIIDFS